jgi:hypothetical protein
VQLSAARETESGEGDAEKREGGGLRYARASDREANQKVVFVVGPRATVIEEEVQLVASCPTQAGGGAERIAACKEIRPHRCTT